MVEDTIAAVSTAKGKGGVAMIRISGPDALEVAKKVFRTHGSQITPRRCLYGDIIRENEIIDDGTLTYFSSPHSYTGEDVCEICCHGGIYVTSAVLESVLSSGARIAEAGEFTRRAYINGKLTLSRAEAVGAIIDARTDNQAFLVAGKRRSFLKALRNKREYACDALAFLCDNRLSRRGYCRGRERRNATLPRQNRIGA